MQQISNWIVFDAGVAKEKNFPLYYTAFQSAKQKII